MSQPYVGEIRMFGGNFPPNGWMFCEGQLLAIAENDTLFNLIGTTYGGDGQSTFALPDLRGRLPIHNGTNPNTGSTFQLGEAAGAEEITLTTQQIPTHTHPMQASTADASSPNPGGNVLSQTVTTTPYYNDTPNVALNFNSITPAGGSQPHTNFQPYLCIDFIISLFGIFPTQ